MQHHENPKIFKKSSKLLEDWFGEYESEEEDADEPEQAQSATFPPARVPNAQEAQVPPFQFAPPQGTTFSFPM